MVSIYGLVGPGGVVRYVGRTKQRLSTRLGQHVDNARRGRFKHPRAEWIREALKDGGRVLITHLETVVEGEQVEAEGRWIGRFKDLVNSGSPSQGGTRSYVVDWTPELDSELGKVSDSVLAERLGVTRKAITYRRKVLGVPASYDRTRNSPPPAMGGHNRIELEGWIVDLLGSMPDHKLSEKAGVSKRTINRARRKRGIVSYAQNTGNDGCYRPGSYPMRWMKDGT